MPFLPFLTNNWGKLILAGLALLFIYKVYTDVTDHFTNYQTLQSNNQKLTEKNKVLEQVVVLQEKNYREFKDLQEQSQRSIDELRGKVDQFSIRTDRNLKALKAAGDIDATTGCTVPSSILLYFEQLRQQQSNTAGATTAPNN